jgi:hypothetical protein
MTLHDQSASFDKLRMRGIESGPYQGPQRTVLILSLSKDAIRSCSNIEEET